MRKGKSFATARRIRRLDATWLFCHGACKVPQSPRQITFRRLLDITSYVTLPRIFIARAFCPRSAPRGVLPVQPECGASPLHLSHGGTFISAMRSVFQWRGCYAAPPLLPIPPPSRRSLCNMPSPSVPSPVMAGACGT